MQTEKSNGHQGHSHEFENPFKALLERTHQPASSIPKSEFEALLDAPHVPSAFAPAPVKKARKVREIWGRVEMELLAERCIVSSIVILCPVCGNPHCSICPPAREAQVANEKVQEVTTIFAKVVVATEIVWE